MIVIGDVHGCFNTLKALLCKLPSNVQVCFVGDLIDRGENSKEVVELIKNERRFTSVRGNHEDFLIHSYYDDGMINSGVYQMWMADGGGKTVDSFGSLDSLMAFREYCKSLPICLQFSDRMQTKYIVSHSYCGLYWKSRNDDYHTFAQETMWSRDFNGDLGGRINIIGHTPVDMPHAVGDRLMIDTGCVFGGYLTAIDLETKTIFQQKNIE